MELQELTADERQVLELKRCQLCQDVVWLPALVEQLRDDGIMNRETAATIARVKRTYFKMNYLVDSMQKKGKAGDLDRLADVLEATHLERNRWLADAIWNALDMQLKQLPVDEYIQVEAEYIVYETFAPRAKRMSDTEKKQMVVLLMMRTQIEKNILTNNIEKIMIDGNVEKRQADLKDTAGNKMASSLVSLGLHTGRPLMLHGYEYLDGVINKTFELFGETAVKLYRLQREQEQSRSVMGIDDDSESMNDEILKLLEQNARHMKILNAQRMKLDESITDMEQEIIQIVEEFRQALKGKDRILGLLQAEIRHFRELLGGQKREVRSLVRQIRLVQEMLPVEEAVPWSRQWQNDSSNRGTTKVQKNSSNSKASKTNILKLIGDLEIL